MHVFKVDNLNDMNCLQNHPEDEVIYVEKENKYFKWNGTEYEEFHFSTNDININLYDLNKQLISQMKPLSKEEINGKKSLFNKFKNETNNRYYMFLCKELSSYTIFDKTCKCKDVAVHDFATEIIELIMEYGTIFAIEKTKDESAIEIWIQSETDEEPHAYYLFPYDAGVVYYG